MMRPGYKAVTSPDIAFSTILWESQDSVSVEVEANFLITTYETIR